MPVGVQHGAADRAAVNFTKGIIRLIRQLQPLGLRQSLSLCLRQPSEFPHPQQPPWPNNGRIELPNRNVGGGDHVESQVIPQ